MEYRGYRATVAFDAEAGLFHGEVAGTRDVIALEGESIHDLEREFAASVDSYLAFCEERGRSPDKA